MQFGDRDASKDSDYFSFGILAAPEYTSQLNVNATPSIMKTIRTYPDQTHDLLPQSLRICV